MSSNNPKLGWARRLVEHAHPFKILEAFFTAVALGAVVVTIAPTAGAQLGVTGQWGLVLGGAVAVVLDLLWVGAMRQLGRAIWQRSRSGIVAMGAVSVAATAASTALMLGIGHAGWFAYLPGLALTATGLRVYVDNAFATRGKARAIFAREAGDRDERAQAEADSRHAVASINTQAVRLVAENNARANAQLALAEQRVAAQIEQNKRYARLEKKLAESEKKSGKAAQQFLTRGLTTGLEERLSLPVWGPSVPLTAPAADSPVTGPQEAVTAAPVTDSGAEAVTPPVTPAVTEGVTPEDPEIEAPSQGGATPPATPSDTDAFGGGVTAAPDMADLEAAAAVAGVETPRPNESLTNEQLLVVLRWLRHSEQPPHSYRKARTLFTDQGFIGGEQRIRNAWAVLEATEAEAADQQ